MRYNIFVIRNLEASCMKTIFTRISVVLVFAVTAFGGSFAHAQDYSGCDYCSTDLGGSSWSDSTDLGGSSWSDYSNLGGSSWSDYSDLEIGRAHV